MSDKGDEMRTFKMSDWNDESIRLVSLKRGWGLPLGRKKKRTEEGKSAANK
jgi:hypothetical protein